MNYIAGVHWLFLHMLSMLSLQMPSPYIAFSRHLGFDELDQVVHRMTNVAGDVLGNHASKQMISTTP